ncbi:MAG TPA: ParB/RepB/Spo0J family partition protein [Actinomycetes bacterium]|nr:ParB/RepB/Spo0J family partition protein [Actinomycetes bacterium]
MTTPAHQATTSPSAQPPVTPTPTPAPAYAEIPLDRLTPAPDNLRADPREDAEAFAELVASIRAHGIVQPLLVTLPDQDGRHQIVAGHRRYQAARDANLPRVPCVIRARSDRERVEAMLVENAYRQQLNPLEEAAGLFRLTEAGDTPAKLARRFGRSKRYVTQRLALLELPTPAQQAIAAGRVPVSAAPHIARLGGHPDRLADLLDRPPHDWEWAVTQALHQAEHAATLAAERTRAAKRGFPVLDAGWELPGEATQIGQRDDQLTVDVDQHRREPCHAIVVLARHEPTSVEVCTRPDRHEPTGRSLVKATRPTPNARAKAGRQQTREQRRADRERTRARQQFQAELLASKTLRTAERHTLIAHGLLATLGHHEAGQVGALLGLTPGTNAWGSKDWDGPIQRFAAGSASNLEQAALAVAFARGEAAWSSQWRAGSGFRRRFAALLHAHGYTAEGDPTEPADEHDQPAALDLDPDQPAAAPPDPAGEHDQAEPGTPNPAA